MARVQYGGGVVNFRGSIAGSTFQRNAGGEIVRLRRVNTSTPTSAMTLVQAATSNLTTIWQSLAPYYIDLWNIFAAANPRINLYGQSKTLSGYNWFMHINSNQVLQELSVTISPPHYSVPTGMLTSILECDAEQLCVRMTGYAAQENTNLVIYTTPPMSSARVSFRSNMRLTKIVPWVKEETFDITNAWECAHNLVYPLGSETFVWLGLLTYLLKQNVSISSTAIISVALLQVDS